jgi:hypothetical protein
MLKELWRGDWLCGAIRDLSDFAGCEPTAVGAEQAEVVRGGACLDFGSILIFFFFFWVD